MSQKSEVGAGSYQSQVLSCILRHRYQVTTSEDFMFAAVVCKVCVIIFCTCVISTEQIQLSIHTPCLVTNP
jgi:hypothetical protein